MEPTASSTAVRKTEAQLDKRHLSDSKEARKENQKESQKESQNVGNGSNETISNIGTTTKVNKAFTIKAEAYEAKSGTKITGIVPDTREKFLVPETHDMVSNLFDIRIKKSYLDYLIVAVLVSYVALYVLLPKSMRTPVFLVMFGFWRLAYNGGIGWLLDQQSKHKRLTKWARDSGVFDRPTNVSVSSSTSTGSPATSTTSRAGTSNASTKRWIHWFLYKNFTTQMGDDYDFYKVPLEYNTWLVFRSLVDMILMSDFTCYMMLVFSCWAPTNHSVGLIAARWFAGWVLFFFNLWVKLDAHRVVKDYAWYWGDFFFLEDLDLTFDGVFQMAPHPMYSIGYAGYYGFCLMTASYTLFFASVLAHALQFVFLIVVENPHIEKTYNAKPPRKSRLESFSSTVRKVQYLGSNSESNSVSGSSSDVSNNNSGEVFVGDISNNNAVEKEDTDILLLRPPLLIFKNFNITRSSDIMLVISTALYTLLAFGESSVLTALAFVLTLSIRLFHNIGLGYLLHEQSINKLWTRVFLKYGRSAAESYEEWQVLYNASTVMSYVSLVVYFIRQYQSPVDSGVPLWPFRYIIGVMLISLQIWTSYSIYESLGNYGWFFGDFFYLKEGHSLTFSGIYRYLNNPERLFGIAGVWGAALISNSFSIAFLAFVWTIGQLCFIKFVEQPHMQKLYGDQIKHEAGVVRTIKQAAKLPQPLEGKVKQLNGSLDKVLMETSQAVESFIGQAKPKVSDAKKAVNETKVFLKQYPARLTIHIQDGGLDDVNPALYELNILTESSLSDDGTQPLKYELGTPIRVSWKADKSHSTKDWIGVYHVSHNQSMEVTRISSKGLWSSTTRKLAAAESSSGFSDDHIHVDGIKDDSGDHGIVEFSGAILPWTKGVYEFRYHHNGKHNVLAVSQPFEICVTAVQLQDIFSGHVSDADNNGGEAVAQNLLSRVSHCFDGTGLLPPATADELWDIDDDVLLQRLVYLIKESYGIDLAASVVLSCKSVRRLAAKLVAVNQALLPLTQ